MKEQLEICRKYNVEYFGFDLNGKVGVSESVLQGSVPVHGIRHIPANGDVGWYLWAGDFSEASDFFKPIHGYHLIETQLWIIKYLGLPPGYRILVSPDYENVWFDETVLW